MTDIQLMNQLKFKVSSLENDLRDRTRELEDYKTVEQQADSKIKGSILLNIALTKIHNEKVKSLLNSIQILKKEKASVEGLTKEHKRSKLIEQLNKEILDQDIVIEVLRKYIYDEKGKEMGRSICDEIIVKELTKGPERIRPLTREELRMEIDKLKAAYAGLESKMKVGGKNEKGKNWIGDDQGSELSSITEKSFVNQNEEVFRKLREVQYENENLKLELNSKTKIIEKLRNDLKGKDKLKAELEMLVNEVELSNRKVQTYEALLRESKQSTNAKIADLYERELKVEELEMQSKEDSQKMLQAHESNNILLQELRFEKTQLVAELESLRKENEQLMLENSTSKKRQDEQKQKISEIRDINEKKKNELAEKLAQYEKEIAVVLEESRKNKEAYRNIEMKLFEERGTWVEEKVKLIDELEALRGHQLIGEGDTKMIEEFDRLRAENAELKELKGTTGSDDHILLERLENYRRKIEFYESKGEISKERKLLDEMFNKFEKLSLEFQEYKKTHKESTTEDKKPKRTHIVELNRREQESMLNLSSGISNLNLEDIDSEILENFDSSYEYEVRINEKTGKHNKYMKITEEDKELLKLISSDLWTFVKDEQLTHKIEAVYDEDERQEDQDNLNLQERIRKIKNLSHPQGNKITLYEHELNRVEAMNDSVSVTSAMEKQYDKYDSDVNIEIKKIVDGKNIPYVNMRAINNVSLELESDVVVSSVHSGDSIIGKKKKKTEKATRIKLEGSEKAKSIVSELESSIEQYNSEVSSVDLNDSELERISSDISTDFRKKKPR